MTGITQLQPGAWGGIPYGSFSGKSGGGGGKGILTQLQLGGWGGQRYGSFGGKTAGPTTGTYNNIGLFSGKAAAKGYLTRVAAYPGSNSANAPATAQDASKDIYISRHF